MKPKDKVGSAAYFVAAAKTLGRLPMPVRVQLDDHSPNGTAAASR